MIIFFDGEQTREVSDANSATAEVWSSIISSAKNYRFDQYYAYPAKNPQAWLDYFEHRVENLSRRDDCITFCATYAEHSCVLILRDSMWDKEVFGIRMAVVQETYLPEKCSVNAYIDFFSRIRNYLRNLGFKFLCCRVNGDNLNAIHALESTDCRYYETIIWPIVDCNKVLEAPTVEGEHIVLRRAADDDIEILKAIGRDNQYDRGHYFCDAKFDHEKVKSVYSKWVDTAFHNGQLIVTIEFDGEVAGYFITDDKLRELSARTNYQYCGLRSLALSSKFRGKGLGGELFRGTLQVLAKQNAQYIDSGYASKNHLSGRLHYSNNFFPVYEEATFHAWL